MGRPKLTVPKYRLWEDDRGLHHVVWTDLTTGKSRKRGTGEHDKAKAAARMPEIIREIENPPAPSTYTIGGMLEAYKLDRMQSPHSKSFPHTINPLIAYFGTWSPDQLHGDKTWKDYRKWRTGQHVANAGALASKGGKRKVLDSTAVRELNGLRGAISWAGRNGYKGLDTVEVHLPESTGWARERFLTKPEFEKLLEACIEPHTKLFALIALATGGRMSAVLGIKWENVTFPGMLPGEGPAAYTKSFVDPLAIPKGERPKLVDVITFDMGRGRHNKRRGTGVISPSNWRLWSALVTAWDRREQFVESGLVDSAGDQTYNKVTCKHVIAYRGRGLGKV